MGGDQKAWKSALTQSAEKDSRLTNCRSHTVANGMVCHGRSNYWLRYAAHGNPVGLVFTKHIAEAAFASECSSVLHRRKAYWTQPPRTSAGKKASRQTDKKLLQRW